ncbi:SCO-spondin-like [Dermacentor albipictus]|uniref:SCO-spondin-like n=1 Tax=Dermacentor albipictus TaxID=60249 RepID=UPI0031FE030D
MRLVLETLLGSLLLATVGSNPEVESDEAPVSECPMNEEPGDPCSRPDLPCRGDIKEGQSLSPSNSTLEKGCSGCVCREGFRRSAFGECVAESDCRACWRDPFSDYSHCGGCPPVCGEVYPAPCPRTCSPGCYCLDGFVRSSRDGGSCVPVSSCPPKCLYENMVFVTHKSCFPERCGHDGLECGGYDCGRPGCECSPGYHLLDSLTCVDECPAS